MTLTLLLQRSAAGTLEPPDRSRYWFYQLWRLAPKGTRYTPEQAMAIVAQNWHLTSRELRDKATFEVD
jgi:hypothetical protein